MSEGWGTILLFLGVPSVLLLGGLAAEYLVFPAWRGAVRRLPQPWQGRAGVAPVLAICIAGICLVVFMGFVYTPGVAALIGGSVVGIGGMIFVFVRGWKGGWRSALSDLTSALFIGFVVTVFIAALIVFFGGFNGHPVPLDERF